MLIPGRASRGTRNGAASLLAATVLVLAVVATTGADAGGGRTLGTATAAPDSAGAPCEGVGQDAPTGVPDRVAFNRPRLRRLRQDRPQPSARAARSEPRLLALARLAAECRRPLFPRWRRGERLSVDGTAYPLQERRFGRLTRPLARPQRLLPVFTPDPDRWGPVQESLLATDSSCSCLDHVPSPGRVPNGADIAGRPLTVDKNASVETDLDLQWDASCLSAADDYSVHAGELGLWYSHDRETCSTGGALRYTLTPRPGNWYYLVVPLTADAEGSYGTDSDGTQRPVSQDNCRNRVVIEDCP